MLHYKGFYVWYDELQGWHIQDGYFVLSTVKTLGAAKGWITKYLKRCCDENN